MVKTHQGKQRIRLASDSVPCESCQTIASDLTNSVLDMIFPNSAAATGNHSLDFDQTHSDRTTNQPGHVVNIEAFH